MGGITFKGSPTQGSGPLSNLVASIEGGGGTESPEQREAREVAEKYSRMKKGGKVSSASSRADGCCTKGKTRGRMV